MVDRVQVGLDEYGTIDNRRLWDVTQNHLNPLDVAISRISQEKRR